MTIFTFRWKTHYPSVIGWSIGLLAVILLYTSAYHTVGTMKADAVANLPEGLRNALNLEDFTTGAGFVQTTVFNLIGLVVFAIAGIQWGAKCLVAEETSGTLQLTLAQGASRRRVLWQSALALLTWLTTVALVAFAALATQDHLQHLGIGTARVAGGVFCFMTLVTLYSALSFAVGAVTGHGGFAVAIAAAAAVAADLLHGLGRGVSWLEPLQPISPMHLVYGNNPLRNGVDVPAVVSLWCATIALVFIADIGFNRRDLRS